MTPIDVSPIVLDIVESDGLKLRAKVGPPMCAVTHKDGWYEATNYRLMIVESCQTRDGLIKRVHASLVGSWRNHAKLSVDGKCDHIATLIARLLSHFEEVQ